MKPFECIKLPENLVYSCEPTGSRVICNPAPTDTDEGWLVYVLPEQFLLLYDLLKVYGYTDGGSIVYDKFTQPFIDDFVSMRLDVINLIITTSEDFYRKFLIATHTAKESNLLQKSDRIALFQKILYNNG